MFENGRVITWQDVYCSTTHLSLIVYFWGVIMQLDYIVIYLLFQDSFKSICLIMCVTC